MDSLVESGKYGAIDTIDISTNRFYVIMFTSGISDDTRSEERRVITYLYDK